MVDPNRVGWGSVFITYRPNHSTHRYLVTQVIDPMTSLTCYKGYDERTARLAAASALAWAHEQDDPRYNSAELYERTEE